MKTLKHLLFGSALLIAGSSLAGNGLNTFSGNDHIKKQLRKELGFPEFLKAKKEAEVKVSFTVGQDGRASIVSVNTADAELKKYVEEKMEQMHFTTGTQPDQVYNMNVVFKRI